MTNDIQTTQPASHGGMLGNVISKNSAIAVAQTRELAETLAAVQMAKAFPRDMIAVREDVKRECMRPKLAQQAVYTYARKGATAPITGPSIRLAEVLTRCMTNIDAGWREIEQDAECVKCEAFAWDKERNSRHCVTFTVSKFRHTRQGDYFLTDPRDIYEKCANEAARRKRACILAVVPGDVVDEAVDQCGKTLAASVDVTPEGVKKLLAAFKDFGVSKSDIERRIQRKAETILPAQVVDLRNVYNALKDGMGTKDDYFKGETVEASATEAQPSAEAPKNDLRAALGIGKGKTKAKPSDAPQVKEEANADAPQGEVAEDTESLL